MRCADILKHRAKSHSRARGGHRRYIALLRSTRRGPSPAARADTSPRPGPTDATARCWSGGTWSRRGPSSRAPGSPPPRPAARRRRGLGAGPQRYGRSRLRRRCRYCRRRWNFRRRRRRRAAGGGPLLPALTGSRGPRAPSEKAVVDRSSATCSLSEARELRAGSRGPWRRAPSPWRRAPSPRRWGRLCAGRVYLTSLEDGCLSRRLGARTGCLTNLGVKPKIELSRPVMWPLVRP